MFAPAKTPPDVVKALNAAVASASADRAFSEKLMTQGIVPQPMGVDEFGAFVRSDTAKFGQIIKDAGITLGN
jgi:tripartite-type tricarboxylate transporter receptor subunit TctC